MLLEILVAPDSPLAGKLIRRAAISERLGAVLLQGLLGGLTVLYHLPPAVSIGHGVLAQSFFLLSLLIAFALAWISGTRELFLRWWLMVVLGLFTHSLLDGSG